MYSALKIALPAPALEGLALAIVAEVAEVVERRSDRLHVRRRGLTLWL